MDPIEEDLMRASESLTRFVEGPGQQAANTLEQAFLRAGQTIEQTLVQAAQSGETGFRRMTEAVLADLARIAAETVIAQAGLGRPRSNVNVNIAPETTSSNAPPSGALGSFAGLVAAAAIRGARYG